MAGEKGAVLSVKSGTLRVDTGMFRGEGVVDIFPGATMVLEGHEQLHVLAGDCRVEGAGRLLLVRGGLLLAATTARVSKGSTLELRDGRIVGKRSGDIAGIGLVEQHLKVDGFLHWSGGDITGDVTVGPPGVLRIDGATTYANAAGKVRLAGSGEVLSQTSPRYRGQLSLNGRLLPQSRHLLWYDGVFLSLIDVSSRSDIRRWVAFSGNPGVDASPESQRKPDKGPIPAGLYVINPAETLSRDKAESTWDWIKWTIKSPSWGIFATPLLALTDAYPRSGFHIHGGSRPGSAGCIDLVEGNGDFHKWFREQVDGGGHPLLQYVLARYVPISQQSPRTHSRPDNCPDNPGLFCTQNSNCRFNRRFAGDGFPQYESEHNGVFNHILDMVQ